MPCITRSRRRVALALLVTAGAAEAQSNVLVVDRSGAGQFVQIQDAVLAAQEGDTILVRIPAPQIYGPVDVNGKSLTIAADSSTQLAGVERIRVRNLAPDQTVVLSRLYANPTEIGFFGAPPTLWLQDNQGPVRIVGCQSNGSMQLTSAGVRIESSTPAAALAGCTVLGGSGLDGHEFEALPGGAGLELRNATAATFDCSFTGGLGGELHFLGEDGHYPGTGGAGVVLEHVSMLTALFDSNSSVNGGIGGERHDCLDFPWVGGNGGTGLVLGALTLATYRDGSLTGGPGGPVIGCAGTPGAPGEPFQNSGGQLLGADGPHVAFTSPTVAREGQVITLHFEGAPGDEVFLIEGRETTTRRLSGGMLVVKPARAVRHVPPIPLGSLQGGTLDVAYMVPQVPAGAINLWLQAYTRHGGAVTMGSFSVVTVLDSVH